MRHRLRVTPRFIAFLTLLCVAFAAIVFISQSAKLKAIAARQAELNEQMLRAKAVVRTGDMGSCCTMELYSASGMEKYVKQFDCRFEEV